MKISAVILTKNEEKNLERCLKSLSFVDEIIIIDDYSSDKTKELVDFFKKKLNILFFQKRLSGDFSSQRNFGLQKAKNQWVLFVDADEEISSVLSKEIQLLTPENEIRCYYLKRRDFFWERELRFGETIMTRNQGIIRLVKKDSGRFEGKVHEEFIFFKQKAKTKKLSGFINHYPHQTTKEFLKTINDYSTIRARELFEKGEVPSLFQLIFYPMCKFLLTYFLYLGFLDGPAGFVYSFMMSFHSFLVRAKLFQYYGEKSQSENS